MMKKNRLKAWFLLIITAGLTGCSSQSTASTSTEPKEAIITGYTGKDNFSLPYLDETYDGKLIGPGNEYEGLLQYKFFSDYNKALEYYEDLLDLSSFVSQGEPKTFSRGEECSYYLDFENKGHKYYVYFEAKKDFTYSFRLYEYSAFFDYTEFVPFPTIRYTSEIEFDKIYPYGDFEPETVEIPNQDGTTTTVTNDISFTYYKNQKYESYQDFKEYYQNLSDDYQVSCDDQQQKITLTAFYVKPYAWVYEPASAKTEKDPFKITLSFTDDGFLFVKQ